MPNRKTNFLMGLCFAYQISVDSYSSCKPGTYTQNSIGKCPRDTVATGLRIHAHPLPLTTLTCCELEAGTIQTDIRQCENYKRDSHGELECRSGLIFKASCYNQFHSVDICTANSLISCCSHAVNGSRPFRVSSDSLSCTWVYGDLDQMVLCPSYHDVLMGQCTSQGQDQKLCGGRFMGIKCCQPRVLSGASRGPLK